jgi:hypothetical protein
MSKSSWLKAAGWVSGTPSTTIAAEGSLLRAWLIPRITTKLVPEFCVVMKVTFGTALRKSAGLVMPFA